MGKAGFGARAIPVYVGEWIISQFMDGGELTEEGRRGISFEKLFLPYLKGATEIRIYDPYIRLQYQVFNLMSFCEILEPQESPINVSLITTTDEFHEYELTNTLSELKKGLSRDDIEFTFTFDPNLQDRWIETDTGWRIILGRGLDIFQKPDDKFTLGFMDQTKRKCKATSIVYTRVENRFHKPNEGQYFKRE